jgi:hypothetical protein
VRGEASRTERSRGPARDNISPPEGVWAFDDRTDLHRLVSPKSEDEPLESLVGRFGPRNWAASQTSAALLQAEDARIGGIVDADKLICMEAALRMVRYRLTTNADLGRSSAPRAEPSQETQGRMNQSRVD